MGTDQSVDFRAIQEAAERIRGQVHETPVATCRWLDDQAGVELFFKCEHLQKVGAFKFRGASNAVMRLTEAQARRGVATHSSGNHAQAVALAARMRGIEAHIVMPSNAPSIKRRAVEGYGGRVIECAPTLAAREAAAAAVVEETGAALIHAYNHPDVIAGQGTAALELMAQVPDLDAIMAPVGGGGLMAGTCVAASGINPSIRLLGAEPAGADDAARSLETGSLQPQLDPRTIADGLRTSLGSLAWPILRERVEVILRVEEAAIVEAMRLCWERAKLMIEPSSAVPVAAALDPGFRGLGVRRVGIILSGGNVDLDRLPWGA